MPRGSIRAKTEVCLPPQPDFSHQGTLPPNHPTRQLNTFAGLTLRSSHWGYNIVPVLLERPPSPASRMLVPRRCNQGRLPGGGEVWCTNVGFGVMQIWV